MKAELSSKMAKQLILVSADSPGIMLQAFLTYLTHGTRDGEERYELLMLGKLCARWLIVLVRRKELPDRG